MAFKEKAIRTTVKIESHQSKLTIPAKFLESCLKYPEKAALLYKKGHTFGYVQYKRLLNLVENFTLSLEKMGVRKGDRVVVISENRPEWAVADLSVKSLGAILVPIHKVFSIKQIKTIVYEVEPALFIVSDAATLFKIHEVRKALRKNIPVIFLDVTGKNDKTVAKDGCDFISALKLLPHDNHGDIYKKRLKELRSSETAAIIYTPSTNGRYRGVELTHNNFVSNVLSCKEAIKFRPDDRFLSVLPLSHAFEKTTGYYIPLFTGSTISYLTDIAHFSKTIKEFKPTVIMGVPRIFEKTYRKTMDTVKKNKLSKFLMEKGLNNRNKSLNFIYDKLLYKKIRENLGGNLRFVISGGAALKPEVGNFFSKIGIPLLEGYGLTESAPVVSVNRLENYKIGTVGHPVPKMNVRIADDGEILLSGPHITPGYFKQDMDNKIAFEKGWFKTGDYGELDKEGFLKIIGKKKEIIVLSTGKNVSPNAIEAQLVKSKYIKQAFVVGDGQKSIAALILPSFRALSRKFLIKEKKDFIQSKDVKVFIQQEIDRLLANFAHYEQVRKFTLIEEPFGVKEGTLTLQGNLFRKEIEKIYEQTIEKLYEENGNNYLVN